MPTKTQSQEDSAQSSQESLDEAADVTGWNAHSKLEVACEFIDHHLTPADQKRFAQFVADKVKEEEG